MRRDRTPTPPAPEPWNPDQWPDPEPVAEPTPLADPALTDMASPTEEVTDIPTVPPPPATVTDASANEPWTTGLPTAPIPATVPGSEASTAPADTGRAREGWRARRSAVIVGVCAVVIVAVVAVIGALVLGLGRHSADNNGPAMLATPTPSASASDAPAATDCPSTVNGPVTTGRDAGDQNSGPGVIKAFQYDYYVRRDGTAARALATPTARVGKAEDMQGFINALPPKTRHCLKITDQGKGVYGVELSEIPPGGGAATVYKQNVQTTEADGKTWIVSIDPVDN